MGSGITLNGQELFPSDWLGAPDLAGKDVVVTISKVDRAELYTPRKGKSVKVIIEFTGKRKRLVCNKTNASTIAKLHGTEVLKWVGKAITLYPTTCQNGPQTVPCIRVREIAPRQGSTPPPVSDEEAAAIRAAEVAAAANQNPDSTQFN